MADAGGIISDTGRVPVAQELVRPEQTQNGSVPGQHTGSNGGQVGSADQQAATLHSNGKPDQPSNSKGGILDTLKGPRSGIHWGADRVRLAAEKGKSNFSHPLGVKPKHRKIVRTFGQIGWVFKGLVYAIIGGVACQAAAQGVSHVRGGDISPQGAFILVGNNSFGYPLLIVMAIGVFTYASWRFWEGITGQGSDDAFGPYKNFFRYRLSPLVSGTVYTAYGIFVITLIPRFKNIEDADSQGSFPDSWRNSGIGKFGLAVFGLAFLIATITQLQAALTRNFHYDMKDDLPNWLMWTVIVTGHIGFIGRAGVFLFVGILFFRLISDESVADPNTTTIGNGLAQLQKSHGGRACLFILGFVLIVYGAFAVMNAYCKVYPTPPPSRRPIRMKQARLAAEKAARRGGEGGEDSAGGDQDDAAPARQKLGEPAWNHPQASIPTDIQLDEGDSPKTADYKQRQRERYLANRDIEAGLGEEWAGKGRLGTAERPHWGHNFWHGSYPQGGQVELSKGQHDPVMPMAPVAEGASANTDHSASNTAVNTSQPTGWV
ncbi:hypothetical protein ABBQ38_014468 [Trebouxia sp. C0009 RCD-2024]